MYFGDESVITPIIMSYSEKVLELWLAKLLTDPWMLFAAVRKEESNVVFDRRKLENPHKRYL